MGDVDHRPDHRGARGADPTDAEAVQVDAEPAAPAARDQGDPGQVQGRQAASEPGDDEVLPGEQGQSPGLLPTARLPAARLPGAVLHAADGPQEGHLRRVLPAVRAHAPRPDPREDDHRLHVRPDSQRLCAVWVHSGPDRQGHRGRAGRADRPLRRLAGGLDPDDVGDGRQEPAAAVPGPAAGVRGVHHQLPGRPDRLLDHHELLDDRPAVRREEDGGADEAGDRRRARARRRGRRRCGWRWRWRRQ